MHDPLQQQQSGQPQRFDSHHVGGKHYGLAPALEEHDGWGKIGIVMVALAVSFAGAVAYFIATSGGTKEEKKEPVAALGASANGAATSADAWGAAMVLEPAIESSPDAAALGSAPEPAGGGSDAGVLAQAPDDAVGGTVGLLRANGELDRPAGLVSLAIESEPGGATVIRKRDGVRLGTTPYRYEVESSAAKVSFVLKLDGYRSTSIAMPGDKDGIRQVMLLPGKGGVPIPEVSPEPAKTDSTKPAVSKTKARSVVLKPTPKPKPKPNKTTLTRPKRPAKPKRPSTPKPPKKPVSGKVDYKADPIPF
ncbi:MAG: hypothetical protein GY811_23705 [Myxococcales bacterium]|nr:hypothetical protein [Myxococcales bacterium]